MSFESTLYSYLKAYAGLAALIDDRVYPDLLPQETIGSCVVYVEMYRKKIYSHNGYSNAGEYTMQITSYAKTKDEVIALAAQVAAAMDAWPDANSQIGFCFQTGEDGDWIEPIKMFFIDQGYRIFYCD